MAFKGWMATLYKSFSSVSGDGPRQAAMPNFNEDLPRFSIPLDARPDLQENLQAVLDIIRMSCPKGKDITTALGAGNTRILVFSDHMMDRMADKETEAAQATIPGGSLLCLRESALTGSEQHFNLIRQIAHEGTHVDQQRKFPLEFGNRSHPHYVANTIAFEKEAFANAAEMNLAIVLQKAQAMARASGKSVPLRQTTMVQDWLRHQPEEVEVVLSTFESDFAKTRNAQSATNATRAAVVANFERHHESDYRQKAIIETRHALSGSCGFSHKPE